MINRPWDVISSSLSKETGDLEGRICSLKEKYMQLWWQTGILPPEFAKSYTKKKQKFMEKASGRFLDRVMEFSAQYAQAKDDQEHSFQEPIDFMTQSMMDFFQWVGIDIDKSFSDGFVLSTQGFMQRAGEFDPQMRAEGIYQALRNIWITNTLQVYMGKPIHCSDAMFAYSMLYPYTDNLLDNRDLDGKAKLQLMETLRERLEGGKSDCKNPLVKKWSALVTKIEQEFPRSHFPGVYQSLLGIYNAQVKSLIQHHPQMIPNIIDILGISFEKGGTSVLADGFLVYGELTQEEEDFCFGLGTFLQLADDIQDVYADYKNGHHTVFSQVMGKYELDMLANKLFQYFPTVLGHPSGHKERDKVRDLYRPSFQLHIMEAVGKNRKLYNKNYVKKMQGYFPIEFSFLSKLRKKLGKVYKKQAGKNPIDMNIVSAGLLALTARVYEK